MKKPIKSTPKTTADRIKGTFLGVFYMMPLGILICLVSKGLGSYIGSYSPFLPRSFFSWQLLIFLLLYRLINQAFLRSIIYSIASSYFLLYGIFSAWFGSLFSYKVPTLADFQPFFQAKTLSSLPLDELIIAGVILVFIVAGIAEFFIALIVKSFFEMAIDRDMGDGKAKGFSLGLLLTLSVWLFIHIYVVGLSDNKKAVLGEYFAHYYPPSQLIVDKPSFAALFEGKVFLSDNKGQIVSFSAESLEKKPSDIQKSFGRPLFYSPGVLQLSSALPFFGQYGVERISADGSLKMTKLFDYPITFPDFKNFYPDLREDYYPAPEPISFKILDGGKYFLLGFLHGYFGLYDSFGNKLWLEKIYHDKSSQVPYLLKPIDDLYIAEYGKTLILSIPNGTVVGFERDSGKIIWQYIHDKPIKDGVGQFAILKQYGNKVIAAFATGEIVTLSAEDGVKQAETAHSEFVAASPFYRDLSGTISFFTEKGIFYIVRENKAEVLHKALALSSYSKYYPAFFEPEFQIAVHKNEITRFNSLTGSFETLFRIKRRTFTAKPVIAGEILYAGSEDGWIYAVRITDGKLLGKVHVKGMLQTDSLNDAGDFLLVRTASNSLFKVAKYEKH